MLTRFGFVLAAALAVSMLNPVYGETQTGGLPVGSTWQEGVPQTILGQQDSVLTTAFPDMQWWKTFNDSNLNSYMEEGLKNSPVIEQQISRVLEARAVVGQNVSKELPTVDAKPSYIRAQIPSSLFGNGLAFPSTIKNYQLPFSAAYEVDLFGKYLDMTKSARKQLAGAIQNQRAAQIALEGDIATAYFNLIKADELVDSETENLKLLSRIYELKQNQNQMGLVTYDEVIRSDRDVAQAQTNLVGYEQQQATAAHQLAILIGRPPQTAAQLPHAAVAQITLPQQTASGIPSALLSRRPDVLAAEDQLEKSKIDVTVARKAFLPTINLSGLVGTIGTTFTSLFHQGHGFNYETVSIDQPIFEGGNLIATLHLRKAQQREQVANYRQTVLTAMKEVEDNLALLRTDYENLDSNNKRLSLTQHDLALRQNLYTQGLSPHSDVLQGQSELTGYQQLAIQSKMDAAIATVNLYKALGGGF